MADRRERTSDSMEAFLTAVEGKLAEVWTAMPGLIESFDANAMTVSVQPAIKGQIQDEKGKTTVVNLPLLVDVPVFYPCGGGFTLTYPIKKGDECIIIFASRCIDGWWQNGGIGGTPDDRLHDLSDGIAIVGIRSQPNTLTPAVDTENVQLRTDDGKAYIMLKPDYTIQAKNPKCSTELTPSGEATIKASTSITLCTPLLILEASAISMKGQNGQAAQVTLSADIKQEGSIVSTGDHTAGGISLKTHLHKDSGGNGSSGTPIAS